jgi:hypothetical protein
LPGRGLAEPVLEAGRGDAWVVAGDEGVLVELFAEVAGVDVGRHRARVVVGSENQSTARKEAQKTTAAIRIRVRSPS